MLKHLRNRLISSLLSLAALIVIVFFLSRLTGDPSALYLPLDASIESRENFREINGLNDPLIVQFSSFAKDIVQFDFGKSLRTSRPALEMVLEAFIWTLQLALITIALVILVATVIGSLAAFNVGGLFDRVATVVSLIGASAPDFWIAIVGILIFSIGFGWLPTSGTGSLLHWVLPVAILFIRPFGLITQVVRNSMIAALHAPYTKTARAKGAGPRRIIFGHSLRNAALPIVTVMGDQAAGMLNGAVIVETIFGFPGVGKLMIDSILMRDFSVILASIVVTAIAILLMNILIDLSYAALDPRTRA
ncbi:MULTISPECIES: ABC transporter permease [Ahrensia]|uniref:ABC transporter permease n=1 Tax=Ahrensia TaxID=152180 RepID=UPI00036F0B23|nr:MULTISPECIES: ABC transporter permease [Ahrensia]